MEVITPNDKALAEALAAEIALEHGTPSPAPAWEEQVLFMRLLSAAMAVRLSLPHTGHNLALQTELDAMAKTLEDRAKAILDQQKVGL